MGLFDFLKKKGKTVKQTRHSNNDICSKTCPNPCNNNPCSKCINSEIVFDESKIPRDGRVMRTVKVLRKTCKLRPSSSFVIYSDTFPCSCNGYDFELMSNEQAAKRLGYALNDLDKLREKLENECR